MFSQHSFCVSRDSKWKRGGRFFHRHHLHRGTNSVFWNAHHLNWPIFLNNKSSGWGMCGYFLQAFAAPLQQWRVQSEAWIDLSRRQLHVTDDAAHLWKEKKKKLNSFIKWPNVQLLCAGSYTCLYYLHLIYPSASVTTLLVCLFTVDKMHVVLWLSVKRPYIWSTS